MSIVEAAISYRTKYNFSLMPCRPDNKKPYLETWLELQKNPPSVEQIRGWFGKWPDAMIGIVTGKTSGICVVDFDFYKMSGEQRKTAEELIPESLICPTSRTPQGGEHQIFQMPQKPFSGRSDHLARFVDTRAQGNYFIAPPSMNGAGKAYSWKPGLSLVEVKPPALPDVYLNRINNYRLKLHEGNTSQGVTGHYEALQ